VFDDSLGELKAVFQANGLAGRMGLGARPALVVVDIQRGFTDPRSALGAEADSTVTAICELMDDARGAGVPIVYTTCVWTEVAEAWSRKLPAQRMLVEGSEWVELDPRLDPRDGELLIEKHFASAFFDTGLRTHLTQFDVDTVIVTGMTTSGCVRASVVDACSHGFNVVVPQEAVADRAAAPHAMSLFDMDAKYADVLACAEVRGYLASLASS
jgi:nicotinamidase-related amidase